MNPNKIELNTLKNRFLPIPINVVKGLEPEPKLKDFDMIKELGVGSFGRVILVSHKKTKAQYAIKAIDKRNKTNIEEKPYFRRELEVMYKIHHPNVVKLFGHFEDDKFCYFLMEYIGKGNVYNLITKDIKKRLSTQMVASVIKDVISAVFFLHNMDPPIIHRDIKPENVLLTDNMIAKLTDFGWSNYIEEDEVRKTVCGTPIYLAPEIIKQQGHDEKVDIWCIGVLLFELITGHVPFLGNDLDTLKRNILNLRIAWPKDINPDAKNLISQILKLDPKQRISLEQMLKHPFFLKYFPNAASCLILPNESIKYKTFIVSKDDPKNWDPIVHFTQNNNNFNNNNNKGNVQNKQPMDKYQILQEKYESLKNDYNAFKSNNQSLNEIEELKKKIREKNEKLEQLMKSQKLKGGGNNQNLNYGKYMDEDENVLQSKCNNLENENYNLREKVLAYEKKIKDKQGQDIDKQLMAFGETLGDNKNDYYYAIEDLKSHLDKETRQNLNEIIYNKEKEIEKYREQEKSRREDEKKKFTNLINRYDKTLSWVEKENKELKMKIKELEAKLPKK